jgi:beta-lactamase class A
MLTRRALFAHSLLVAWPVHALAQPAASDDAGRRLAALEKKHGGRLGVAFLDLATNRRIAQRADERFAMCSTFKLVLAAFVLARVDKGEEQLDRRVTYSKADLITYSPVTEKHVGAGMTVGELCRAATSISDNTAANLLLASVGGPAQLTAYIRTLGDRITRLDRIEPELNDVPPGDPRDTTTPSAMLHTVQQLILGNALPPASRDRLTAWFVGNETGNNRLRAGFPKGWRVGDKTGTGPRAATNDVGVAWPPARKPVVLAVYYDGSDAPLDARERVIADVARVVAHESEK